MLNANSTPNKGGDIHFTTTLYLCITRILHKVLLHIMNCGKENIILRLPWLTQANPTVNWREQTLSINTSTNQVNELYQTHASDDVVGARGYLHS